MTDSEMLDRLMALFYISEGEVFWPYIDEMPIGHVDSELEKAMLARPTKLKGLG